MHVLFATTLLVSAALLFALQPMFAKMVLPQLGGSPAVWSTCMLFYQAVLLAGYVYAHLTTRWLGPRRQAIVHLCLLALPWLVLPIALRDGGPLASAAGPGIGLLGLLTISIGLPFFVVSASSPMLQAWFSHTEHSSAEDPYFLYAASNLGSMAALLGYPLLVEPLLPLAAQSLAWTVGYGLLLTLTVACAAILLRSPVRQTASINKAAITLTDKPKNPPHARDKMGTGTSRPRDSSAFRPVRSEPVPIFSPTLPQRLHWLALSFIPSSLLLGVTAYLSTDVAAVPLLWVVPLALYLLTFVLVFARRTILPQTWVVLFHAYVVLLLAVIFFLPLGRWAAPAMAMHLAAFFLTALVCHGELARQRPAAQYLTEFYLWMSIGGVLGGVFNALVAPRLFSTTVEYPLMIVAACLLRPWPTPFFADDPRSRWLDALLPAAMLLVLGVAILGLNRIELAVDAMLVTLLVALAAYATTKFRHRPLRFALGVGVLMLAGLLSSQNRERVLYRERSFFGVLQVKQDPDGKIHRLVHGSTNHGLQMLGPKQSRIARSYYYPTGPLGQVFSSLSERKPQRKIGVIGLGAGSIAAYGRTGQQITFYEIDPAVIRIARNPDYFTFLRDTPANVQIVPGDARLSLGSAEDGQFDLLILDAFSSDAIPVHLITREAIQLYFRKLRDEGVLALHISNRFLDLGPLTGRLAADAGAVCRIRRDQVVGDDEARDGKHPSTWVVMARRSEDLGTLQEDSGWEPIPVDPQAPLWTDDFSNILAVLKR